MRKAKKMTEYSVIFLKKTKGQNSKPLQLTELKPFSTEMLRRN